jgi:hypothetical protein
MPHMQKAIALTVGITLPGYRFFNRCSAPAAPEISSGLRAFEDATQRCRQNRRIRKASDGGVAARPSSNRSDLDMSCNCGVHKPPRSKGVDTMTKRLLTDALAAGDLPAAVPALDQNVVFHSPVLATTGNEVRGTPSLSRSFRRHSLALGCPATWTNSKTTTDDTSSHSTGALAAT